MVRKGGDLIALDGKLPHFDRIEASIALILGHLFVKSQRAHQSKWDRGASPTRQRFHDALAQKCTFFKHGDGPSFKQPARFVLEARNAKWVNVRVGHAT